ncbi:uncharacterized protein LOC131302382 [Rhododendron vialii]|uniref:uncharacterized protein LOC131302382 n=1 Tax=Rhododendron vialii TaxID=182163 RepID=UPI00266039EF|nr:uncharacterized protein LOC131302382 [Rhododendron vialii]
MQNPFNIPSPFLLLLFPAHTLGRERDQPPVPLATTTEVTSCRTPPSRKPQLPSIVTTTVAPSPPSSTAAPSCHRNPSINRFAEREVVRARCSRFWIKAKDTRNLGSKYKVYKDGLLVYYFMNSKVYV